LDNECSKCIQNFLEKKGTTRHHVAPHSHRVNAAEPAVKTAKYHLIAALATLDWGCPVQLWSKMLKQVQDTLNMFRTSRNNTSKTAYQELEGNFDWNATPMAPLGTKGSVFIHPDNRNTFAPHCDEGFTVGRAPHHYRLLEFYIPATRGYRLSGTYRLYPQHCRMPVISEEDRTVSAATELLEKMKKEIPPAAKEKKQWLKIIKKLQATLSHGEPRVAMRGESRVATQGQARVDGDSTTSSSPTCPRTLRTTPRTHQRKTRRNTPVTQHVAIEPAQHGEGLRQTQIYMRSDKAEPGDSLRAEPVPARTATEPRRSSRINTRPQAPLTARDKRARTRTVNKQIIDSKRNNVKHASRRILASLIDTQLNIDKITPPPTKTHSATASERRKARTEPVFTYHIPCPKNKRTPAPVTQAEIEKS